MAILQKIDNLIQKTKKSNKIPYAIAGAATLTPLTLLLLNTHNNTHEDAMRQFDLHNNTHHDFMRQMQQYQQMRQPIGVL